MLREPHQRIEAKESQSSLPELLIFSMILGLVHVVNKKRDDNPSKERKELA